MVSNIYINEVVHGTRCANEAHDDNVSR